MGWTSQGGCKRRGAGAEQRRGLPRQREQQQQRKGTAAAEEGNRMSRGLVEAPERRQATETVA